jgi:hypothetical protein
VAWAIIPDLKMVNCGDSQLSRVCGFLVPRTGALFLVYFYSKWFYKDLSGILAGRGLRGDCVVVSVQE